MKLRIIFLFFTLYLTTLNTFAQTRSAETVKIAGQNFYIHTVKPDETIESIAKLYDVRVVDIEENNPTIIEMGVLKKGQKLRIPDLSAFAAKYPVSQWDFLYHQVKKTQRLKEIARHYKVDVNDIKNVNPGIDNKPAILSKVRIPVKKSDAYKLATTQGKTDNKKEKSDKGGDSSSNPALTFNWGQKADNNDDTPKSKGEEQDRASGDEKEDKSCKRIDYNPRKNTFNISLLLPLGAKNNPIDFTYTGFLEGALLAIEDMKQAGFSANITIKDISEKNSLAKVLEEKTVKNSDLIIGPFSLASQRTMATFAKKNKIPVISPYESRTQTLAKDNPYFIQIHPSDSSCNSQLVKSVLPASDVNVILIHPEKVDSTLFKYYKSLLSQQFPNFKTHKHTMGLRPEAGRTALSNVLQNDVKNILFVASNNESFVSDLLDRLIILNIGPKAYNMSIYGTPHWRRSFHTLDLTNFYALNLHVIQPFYVDYTRDEVKEFIRTYRESFNNEPTQYVFHGYDITYYFLSALKKYGKNFKNCLPEFDMNLLQSNYIFRHIYGSDSGSVNTGSLLLEYTPEMDIIPHK